MLHEVMAEIRKAGITVERNHQDPIQIRNVTEPESGQERGVVVHYRFSVDRTKLMDAVKHISPERWRQADEGEDILLDFLRARKPARSLRAIGQRLHDVSFKEPPFPERNKATVSIAIKYSSIPSAMLDIFAARRKKAVFPEDNLKVEFQHTKSKLDHEIRR